MMRSNPAASMQKTYDDCFLVCSTAVYFESKNNEAEALRSWKNALDQIYYHNAYRLPANYKPKTETERALLESLRQMELQCKERVDLLEALKQSREEAANKAEDNSIEVSGSDRSQLAAQGTTNEELWLGNGTVRPLDYPDIAKPPQPQRPAMPSPRPSSIGGGRPENAQRNMSLDGSSTISLPIPERKKARTPSPEKRQGMLRTLRPGRKPGLEPSTKLPKSTRPRPPAAAKAATQAWGVNSAPAVEVTRGDSLSSSAARSSLLTYSQSNSASSIPDTSRAPTQLSSSDGNTSRGTPAQQLSLDHHRAPGSLVLGRADPAHPSRNYDRSKSPESLTSPSPHYPGVSSRAQTNAHSQNEDHSVVDCSEPLQLPRVDPAVTSYRKEYPRPRSEQKISSRSAIALARRRHGLLESEDSEEATAERMSPRGANAIRRKEGSDQRALTSTNLPQGSRQLSSAVSSEEVSGASFNDGTRPPSSSTDSGRIRRQLGRVERGRRDTFEEDRDHDVDSSIEYPDATDSCSPQQGKIKEILRKLPKGVDEAAARQVLNEVVTRGDEVHWNDIAGLEPAKNALKETVVYPFLRPDLFSGLREPARGMLLFGPPGTGKTMLARAVATESRSTFFAISASSLVSKWLGESEKLVRALFALAKVLAPSIIFVDEIDSLLGSRGGASEHEATRRVKTEFLIQWSDLQRAAAGRDIRESGDASRVLVLAATNLPWEIDEAARRRFVRRQYIPLPEAQVRETQLRTLLSHQKHDLSDNDICRLVQLTTGFSGSDITALAKDAAMGPLRSLGEKLLEMDFEDIRPISFRDFEASLKTIRPSVSKEGLKRFEDWARVYGERAG